MSFNHKGNGIIQTNDGTKLENGPDFKYIGELIESSKEDVKVRKVAAGRACSKVSKIWKSTLPRGFKQRLFAATVESVLVYMNGPDSHTLVCKKVDATFDSSEQHSM